MAEPSELVERLRQTATVAFWAELKERYANFKKTRDLAEQYMKFVGPREAPEWNARYQAEAERQLAIAEADMAVIGELCAVVQAIENEAPSLMVDLPSVEFATIEAIDENDAMRKCRALLGKVMERESSNGKPQLTLGHCEIVEVIRTAGQRLTTQQVLDALSAAGKIPSEGTTKNYLAELVRNGTLNNRRDSLEKGYGLAAW